MGSGRMEKKKDVQGTRYELKKGVDDRFLRFLPVLYKKYGIEMVD